MLFLLNVIDVIYFYCSNGIELGHLLQTDFSYKHIEDGGVGMLSRLNDPKSPYSLRMDSSVKSLTNGVLGS